MGILNATPDSFSDGGFFISVSKAVDHVAKMIDGGADMIDIGGESTRPGASAVSAEEEVDRVIPIIEAISQRFSVMISVDTSKAAVMQSAVNAGAAMINDVRALREAGALETAADSGAAVCLMHMQGEPRSMQRQPVYGDVVADVVEDLALASTVVVGDDRRRRYPPHAGQRGDRQHPGAGLFRRTWSRENHLHQSTLQGIGCR